MLIDAYDLVTMIADLATHEGVVILLIFVRCPHSSPRWADRDQVQLGAVVVATATLIVAAQMPSKCDPTAPSKRVLFVFFLSPTLQMPFD